MVGSGCGALRCRMRAVLTCTLMYMLMVHSVTLARLDLPPEDGPTGTETSRRFYGIFSILMCVNIFLEFYL